MGYGVQLCRAPALGDPKTTRRGFIAPPTSEGSDAPLKAMFRFMLLALAALVAFDRYFFGGIHIEAAAAMTVSMLQHFGK
jgi:hypothetical protein